MTDGEQRWYGVNGHAHCPEGCEHPQERFLNGVMVCGRCLVLCGVITPVVGCTPDVCEERS